jgi:gamma-glutamylcysteine synthetase
MAGKLPVLPGEFPTLNDWENHLTTIFPEVLNLLKLLSYLRHVLNFY